MFLSGNQGEDVVTERPSKASSRILPTPHEVYFTKVIFMPLSRHTKLLPFLRRPFGCKYEILFDDTRQIEDESQGGMVNVYRIRSLVALPAVGPVGTYGGYVQSLDNLSHEGDCWVAEQACVLGHARIWGNARIYGQAIIREDAWVFEDAVVYGEAVIAGTARVFGQAQIGDQAYVGGQALISGHSRLVARAHVAGRCWVAGSARMSGDCWVHGTQIFTKGDWPGTVTFAPVRECPQGHDDDSHKAA